MANLERKQIYLDEEGDRALKRLALTTKISAAEHIRRAVKKYIAKERTINNLNKLMSFLPSSSLLVDHITRYARSSRLEYNKKSY